MNPAKDETRVRRPGATPASIPGAPMVLCRKAKTGWRCIRKAGHGGNCTLVRHEGVVRLTGPTSDRPEPSSPPAGPAGTSTPAPSGAVAVPRPPRASPHAIADALEVAAKLLRWSTHRGLAPEEKFLLGTVHDLIVTRVHGGLDAGVTSPTPDPPP